MLLFKEKGVILCSVCVAIGLLGLLVLASLYTFMALTHRNFKKGLKEKGAGKPEICVLGGV